jgi:hypothetical protein
MSDRSRTFTAMGLEWNKLIVEQLEFYWDAHLRPRLDGLTDDEYLWEPVRDCWNLRRDSDSNWVMDWATPEPEPTPVTTIAWRMMHIAATGFANRASAFFGDDPFPELGMNDPGRYPVSLPSTATDGVAYLEQTYHAWMDGISALDEAGMSQKLGPKGGPFRDDPIAALVVHINREVMHHGAEIGLLRDFYLRRDQFAR